MKKKLSEWKSLAAEKKAAWMKAKGKGIEGADLAKLKDVYLKHQDVVDNAEAEGAKDVDEIEVDAKALGAKESESEQTVDAKELTKMIVEAVQNEFAKASKTEREQVTAEGIKAIVKEVLTEHGAGSKVSVDDVKGIFTDVLKEQRAQIKGKSKMRFDSEENQNDEENGDETEGEKRARKEIARLDIELPLSHCKGNLPLHQKQLLNVLMKRDINDGVGESMLRKGVELGDRTLFRLQGMARSGQKALTSTGSGTGDELVPSDLSSELHRRFFLASDLAAIFAGQEIDQPTQPYTYPLGTTRPTFYLENTENTAATASDPATGSIVLNAKRLIGKVSYSYELTEDSIVPVLPMITTMLTEAAADAYEDALINGDTTATHQDSDTHAISKAAAKAFNGFRMLALAVSSLKSDISSGGLNEANLRALRKLLGKWGRNKRDLIWIAGVKGENDMMGITNMGTQDKVGGVATILTGEINTFLGIPIVVSERCREDLNASGVYDGTTTTKGSILLVNKAQFLTGRRREFTVETDRDISSQTNFIVASFRRGMTPKETPSATIKTVALGYNHTA